MSNEGEEPALEPVRRAPTPSRTAVGALRTRFRMSDVFSTSISVCRRSAPALLAVAAALTLCWVPVELGTTRLVAGGLSPIQGLALVGVAFLATFTHHFLFTVTQGLLASGVSRSLAGDGFHLGDSVRTALARPGRFFSTAAMSGLIVWAWSLLCGIGALYGIRNAYVAMPVSVLERCDASAALARSRRLAADSTNAVVGLTLLFALGIPATSYALGFAIGSLGGNVAELGPQIALAVTASATRALFTTVWAVITCVAYERLSGGDHAQDAAQMADVF